MRVYTKIPVFERFNSKWIPHPKTGCWIWTASFNTHSRYKYFRSGVFADENRKTWRASRMSWKLHCGDIKEGLCVLHKCDNPLCVNPEHLFLGTHQDNSDDMKAKRRQSYGEKRPRSKLTWELVREIRASKEPGFLIAKRLGVSPSSIYLIRAHRTWLEH